MFEISIYIVIHILILSSMSALQKQGTFQVYLTSFTFSASAPIKDGLITVPVQLSGDYHLRINGVSIVGDRADVIVNDAYPVNIYLPEPLFIQSAEFSSSLSNIQGLCILPHVITLVPPYDPANQLVSLRMQQYQQTRYDFSARLTGSLSFFLSVNSLGTFTANLYPATNVFDDTSNLWQFNPVIILDISYKRTDTGFFDA